MESRIRVSFLGHGAVEGHGHVPLWNPNLFNGLPFVAPMHGDIFYPTAWLRLILPTAFVMNPSFPFIICSPACHLPVAAEA